MLVHWQVDLIKRLACLSRLFFFAPLRTFNHILPSRSRLDSIRYLLTRSTDIPQDYSL